jgi:hypothetical protein
VVHGVETDAEATDLCAGVFGALLEGISDALDRLKVFFGENGVIL